MIKSYMILNDLGKGYNAKVKLGLNVLTNKYYAIKIFNTQKIKRRDLVNPLKRNSLINIFNEIEILKALRSPYTISFEEFIEEGDKAYIVMEYVDGGCLQDLIDNSELDKTLT